MDVLPQLVATGLSTGCLYALIALGLVLIYKATDVLNFAQGEAATVGAYLGWMFVTELRLPYFPALFAVAASAALVGVLLERIAYRPLIRAPAFAFALATLAVGLIIKNVIRLIYQDTPRALRGAASGSPVEFAGVYVTPERLAIIFTSAAVVAGLLLFFRFTKLGLAMRATAQNREAAALMGISVNGVFAASWALGTALGGIAGVLIAPLLGVNTGLGDVLIPGFVAAVVGGLTSISGAVVGGIALGVLENIAGVFVSPAFKQAASFLLLLAVLMVRPSGLFGKPRPKMI